MRAHGDNDELSQWAPFGPGGELQRQRFLSRMRALTRAHQSACPEYARMLARLPLGQADAQDVADLPFLPVRLFKQRRLCSVPDAAVIKTLNSSGTSGQAPSRIELDQETAALQSRVLARLMREVLGPRRLPMLVLDAPSSAGGRDRFSARSAAIRGFSLFGRDLHYALDDELALDDAKVEAFLAKYPDQPVLVFGFTFLIWQALVRTLEQSGRRLALDQAIVLHGGGWKKVQDQAVSPTAFRQRLQAATGATQVVNYYGMVEQTGSIFLECPEGRLHASSWSDVVIRDPLRFHPLPPGEPGLIEVLSALPQSYPGHALLSEDLGRLLGRDDCPCGRQGATFTVEGRLEAAEIRGCSDTRG